MQLGLIFCCKAKHYISLKCLHDFVCVEYIKVTKVPFIHNKIIHLLFTDLINNTKTDLDT